MMSLRRRLSYFAGTIWGKQLTSRFGFGRMGSADRFSVFGGIEIPLSTNNWTGVMSKLFTCLSMLLKNRGAPQNRMARIAFLFVLILAISPISSAQDATDPIGLTELSQKLDAIQNNAFDNAQNLSFSTIQQLRILIQQASLVLDGKLDNGATIADDQRAKIIGDVNSLIFAIERGEASISADVDALSSSLESAAARVPLANRSPRVIRTNPSVILEPTTKASAELNVSISGSLLGNSDTRLNFLGSNCRQVGHTDSKLMFACPTAGISKELSMRLINADLSISRRHILWFIGFKNPGQKYSIPFLYVPRKLGTAVAIFSTRKEVAPLIESHSETLEGRNGHCEGNKNVSLRITAPADSVILRDTVQTIVHVRSSQSSFGGVTDLSESGFIVRGVVRNNGDCIRALGKVVSRDGRGTLVVQAKYQTSKKQFEVVEEEAGEIQIDWGSDAVISLPPGVIDWRIKIETDRFTKYITKDREIAWVSRSIQADGNIILRPNDVDSIFN